MAKPAEETVGFIERLKQMGMVLDFSEKQDESFVPRVVAAVVLPLLLTSLVTILSSSWIWIPLGIMIALLAVLIVLKLRSDTAMLNALEGQAGAPRQIMSSLRANWRVKEQPV